MQCRPQSGLAWHRGVGTLTWLTFVPVALAFGLVSERSGVDTAAWFFVAIAVVTTSLIVIVLPAAPAGVAEAAPVDSVPAPQVGLAFEADRFLPENDPQWPGHWATPPSVWEELATPTGTADVAEHARAAIAEMPPTLRQVMVLRDVEGRAPSEVQQALDLSPVEEEAMLHQARGLVRARLERRFEEVRKS